MAVKVVVENAVLAGSQNHTFLQRVATAYFNGREYRVLAPPRAVGPALDWADHFSVREPSRDSFHTESIIEGEIAEHVVKIVVAELKRFDLESDIYDWNGLHPNARFCAALICLHGHVVNVNGDQIREGELCDTCGSRCIHRCQQCDAPIRGQGVYSGAAYIRPNFCYNCAKPYPWMQDRLETARELLWNDDKLDLSEREKLWDLLQYVMTDPKSDLVPAKSKLIEIKLEPALAATREFVLDFLAKFSAEMSKP